MMTTTETTATTSPFIERSQLLTRILELLAGMGAEVELSQGDTVGFINKVNGVPVTFEFRDEKRERWERRGDRIGTIVVSSYWHTVPAASYPRSSKTNQFNVQKLAERLDAITRAAVDADKKRKREEAASDRNNTRLKEFRKEKYGSEYSSDYKRNIKLESSQYGFTVTLTKSVKSVEELSKLVADLEKFIDERSAS